MKFPLLPFFIWVGALVLSLILLQDLLLPFILLTIFIAARFIQLLQVEKWLLLALYIVLPFSIEYEIFPGTQLGIPSEVFALLLSMVAFFKLLPYLKIEIIRRQPMWIFGAIILFLVVMAWSSLFSTMSIVSFKFLAVNILLVVVGFLLTYLCLIENRITPLELILASSFGLTLVCVYSFTNVFEYGIGRNTAAEISKPFFNDHTHFAATLALVFPLLIVGYQCSHKAWMRFSLLISILVFLIFIFLSYSRASWLSLLGMSGIFLLWYFKISVRLIVLLSSAAIVLLLLNITSLQNKFLTNKIDSNVRESTIAHQFQSVTNTTSDVSNVERINRWKCALRMGEAKPLFGFGPGTYQFQYLPFQQKSDLTRISVNSPFFVKEGRGGSAHSEYLLSFSECGYPGLFSWIFLIAVIAYTNITLLKKNNDTMVVIAFTASLGLAGYCIHAFFNNFLNSAQFGLFFWMMISILAYAKYERQQTDADLLSHKQD